MPNWPHDDTASKTKFFGAPGTGLIQLTPPYQMFYDGHALKSIKVNRAVASSLLRVLTEILDKCDHIQANVANIGANQFGGCYADRMIRGSSKNISNHAFGAAIDIDPDRNPLGAKTGKMSPIVINAFKREGWLWGGDYKGRKDWMHFEAVSR